MARNPQHDRERREQVEFAHQYSQEEYRPWMRRLISGWREINNEHFRGALVPPHFRVGRVAPRSLGHCTSATGYGATLEIAIAERLTIDADPAWVTNDEGPGYLRFVRDLLLRLVVQQWVREFHGTDEAAYRGYGPLFVEQANRIGLSLGLAPVIVRRRGPEDAGAPVAAGWPFCVRARDHYHDDVTEALLELAGAAPARRVPRDVAPPLLGAWELVLYLLGASRAEDLRVIAASQVDRLHDLRRRRYPVLARFERGEEDEDGSPIAGLPDFDPAWQMWNGGTVRHITEGIEAYREYALLPILADALEEAGCSDGLILRHLRAKTKSHDSRCWVVRGLLASFTGQTADHEELTVRRS
jgi:hypothetical protein